MVLCDGRLYEIMRGNFERADRRFVIDYSKYKPCNFFHLQRSVIRTTVNSRVTLHYLLTNHDELMFV